jgi:hypothetical protein
MSVDLEVTRQILKEEVDRMAALATSYGWTVATDLSALTVTVRMRSCLSQAEYIIEAKCDNYREMPPFFEFIHPNTGERGTKRCYPSPESSYFHGMPCICIQWNRKAYQNHGGPHGDWTMANWMSYRPSTKSLGDMFIAIQSEIDKCIGRMEQ